MHDNKYETNYAPSTILNHIRYKTKTVQEDKVNRTAKQIATNWKKKITHLSYTTASVCTLLLRLRNKRKWKTSKWTLLNLLIAEQLRIHLWWLNAPTKSNLTQPELQEHCTSVAAEASLLLVTLHVCRLLACMPNCRSSVTIFPH